MKEVDRAPSSMALSVIRVGDGVLYENTSCACNEKFKPEIDVPILVQTAQHYKVDRIVLTGGCIDGHYSFVKTVKDKMAKQGITLLWLDYRYLEQGYEHGGTPGRHLSGWQAVNNYLFLSGGVSPFDPYTDTWEEARQEEVSLPALLTQAELIRDVWRNIDREKRLLDKYPIVRKVKTSKLVTHPAFVKRMEFRENTIIAFDQSNLNCVLVSNGVATKMTVEPGMTGGKVKAIMEEGLVLGFSVPLKITSEEDGISYLINTERGVWYAEPHEEPDPLNPDPKFTPLAQRIRKHPEQKHRNSSGYRRSKNCTGCLMPISQWKNQPVCIALSQYLKEGYYSPPE